MAELVRCRKQGLLASLVGGCRRNRVGSHYVCMYVCRYVGGWVGG